MQFEGTIDNLKDHMYVELAEGEFQIYYEQDRGFILSLYGEGDEYENIPSQLYLKFLSFSDDTSWIEENVTLFEKESMRHGVDELKVESDYDWKGLRRFLKRESDYKVDHVLFAKEI